MSESGNHTDMTYVAYPLTASDPYLPMRRSFIRYVMPKLSGSAVKVYLHLLDVTYEWIPVEGQRQWVFTARPAAERSIAAALEMSRASASQALTDLLDLGLIALVAPGTRTDAAVYRVRLDIEVRVHAGGRVEIVTTEAAETNPQRVTGGSKISPLNAIGGSIFDPPEDQKLIHLINSKDQNTLSHAGDPEPLLDAPGIEAADHPAEVLQALAAAAPPQEQTRLVGEMVNALVEVTAIPARTGGTLNRTFRDKHLPLAKALLADGFTAGQIRTWYGDSNGFWRQGDFRGRKGEWPTFTVIEETIRRAALWTPEQQAAAREVGRAPDRAAVDGAWAAVLAAIRRTGDDLKAMEMLDETTRQAVKAIGYLGQVRRMEPGRNDRTMRARFAEAYQDALALAQRFGGDGTAQAPPAKQVRYVYEAAD